MGEAIVHRCPPSNVDPVMPCCGVTWLDLLGDQVTTDDALVTCTGSPRAFPDAPPQPAQPTMDLLDGRVERPDPTRRVAEGRRPPIPLIKADPNLRDWTEGSRERHLLAERKRAARTSRRTEPSERRRQWACFWTWPFGHAFQMVAGDPEYLIRRRCAGCGLTLTIRP